MYWPLDAGSSRARSRVQGEERVQLEVDDPIESTKLTSESAAHVASGLQIPDMQSACEAHPLLHMFVAVLQPMVHGASS
ncbi:MAG: hypothetical protein JWO36_5566 [Myxococcales bacterium]|nr:hypothetical protein [Myxococcales bacterium]